MTWGLVAAVVAGIGTLVVRSANASILTDDISIAMDRTAVVLGGTRANEELRVTATLPDTAAIGFGFFGMDLMAGSKIVPNAFWEKTDSGQMTTVIRPTPAMDGQKIGVRVHYGLGSKYKEVIRYGDVLTVTSRVSIFTKGPWLIDAANRAPMTGTLSCYQDGIGFHPFHTKFQMMYEDAQKVWHPFPGRVGTNAAGEFLVPTTSIPLDGRKMIRLKVNVPGFAKSDELCGPTEPQADTYEFEIMYPPPAVILPPAAPQTVTLVPGRRSARLGWTPPSSNGGSAILGYQVRRGTGVASLAAGARGYSFTGLGLVQRNTVSVRARNAKGWGPWTSVAFRTTPPAAKVYASCRLMHRDYPGGVGIPGVKQQNYYPSERLYRMQPKRLDSDRDRIACEKQ
jgi:hypothetical protein